MSNPIDTSISLADAHVTDQRRISILDIARPVRRAWKRIAIGCVFGTALAVALSMLMSPTYRSRAVVVPSPEENGRASLSGLAARLGPLAGIDTGGAEVSQKDVWIATLRSRGLLRTFVEQHSLLPVLFEKRWDRETQQWRKPMLALSRTPPTIDDALDLLQRKVILIEEDRNNLVTVTVEWTDPQIAASWANGLVELANSSLRQRVVDESTRNIQFLDSELVKTDVIERRQMILRLVESRTSAVMMAKGRPEYAFEFIDRATPLDLQRPSKPNRPLIAAFGLFASLVIGTAFAVAADLARSIGNRAAGTNGRLGPA